MTEFTRRALTGALLALGIGATAEAQTPALQGGGSDLLAPPWAQATGCWDPGDAPPNGTYFEDGLRLLPPNPGCIHHVPASPAAVYYSAVDSGAGQAALFAHNGALIVGGVPLLGLYMGAPISPSSDVQYSLSDNSLSQADVDIYYFGTGHATAPITPPFYHGVTVPAAKPLYGNLVQFPLSIDPVDLAFNPAYDVANHQLNLSHNAGKLILDRTAYCGIYSGAIKDWSNSYLAAINGFTGATNLTANALNSTLAPIIVVGRADSSGATSIFTRHLAAVCGSPNWTTGTTTLPAVAGIVYDLKTGSPGVAEEIFAVAGAIGYLGNDYIATALNVHSLPAATLKNHNGDKVTPSAEAAALAFSVIAMPSGPELANPLKWVEGPNSTILSDPTTPNAYPIVGTTNFLGYTCYKSVNSVKSIRDLYAYIAANEALLENNGLAPLPAAWITLITSSFLSTTSPSSALFLAEAVTGHDGLSSFPPAQHVNAACTAGGVTGG